MLLQLGVSPLQQMADTSPFSCQCSGVEDSGWLKGLALPELQSSMATLHAMAAEVAASAQLVQQVPGATAGSFCACARVTRLCIAHVDYTDLRIAGDLRFGTLACHHDLSAPQL